MNAVYLAGSVAVMVKLYARRVEWPRVSWPVPGRTQVTVAVSGEAAASAREVTGPGAVSTCTVFIVYRSCECVQVVMLAPAPVGGSWLGGSQSWSAASPRTPVAHTAVINILIFWQRNPSIAGRVNNK